MTAAPTRPSSPGAGQATRLIAGRLRPNAEHEDFGELSYDPATRRLSAVVTLPPGTFRESVAVPDQPWHLYNYDLASLTITAQYRRNRRADFSFGLPLVLVGNDPAHFLSYLGRADARYVRTKRHGGRPDLNVAGAYTREDFRRLMRTGVASGGQQVGLMSQVARNRFSHFTDAEVDAIYDYLAARARR